MRETETSTQEAQATVEFEELSEDLLDGVVGGMARMTLHDKVPLLSVA